MRAAGREDVASIEVIDAGSASSRPITRASSTTSIAARRRRRTARASAWACHRPRAGDAHRGRVEVESEPAGSTFRVICRPRVAPATAARRPGGDVIEALHDDRRRIDGRARAKYSLSKTSRRCAPC